jgi:hypothetical protein
MAAGQGFKTFVTGEVLTAGDVNGYLMQGVLVFATEAARNSAITSPQEGQFAFTKDTNSTWYYDGAAWVASGASGDVTGVTAGNGISVTSPTGPVPTVAIDTSVTVDKTTAQTLTNKTLTAPLINLAFNAQTGTTYTLVAADSGKLVTTSNASAVTVTVPPSVFAAGEQINVQSIGVGLTSFAQGAGVTITSTGASASAPILRARYSAATIICTASNVFTIVGDLS